MCAEYALVVMQMFHVVDIMMPIAPLILGHIDLPETLLMLLCVEILLLHQQLNLL